MEFFLMFLGLLVLLSLFGSSGSSTNKGQFVVRGFKNNELVYMKTYVDETFTVQPGSKFDKVEITEN